MTSPQNLKLVDISGTLTNESAKRLLHNRIVTYQAFPPCPQGGRVWRNGIFILTLYKVRYNIYLCIVQALYFSDKACPPLLNVI